MSSLVLLALVTTLQGGANEPPRSVVRHATAAVEGDSVSVVSRRWERAALATQPDRSAILGLATLARLSYRYAAAESLHARLLPSGNEPPDRVALYARLGQGLSARTRGAYATADGLFYMASTDARVAGDTAAWAEAMSFLAATRGRTAGPRAADSVFQVSSGLIGGDPELEALDLCLRAEVRVLSGRPLTDEASRGAKLARGAGNRRLAATCRHLEAADLQRRGNTSEAVAVFGEVATERRGLRDRAGLANTLQWRGSLMRGMGWLQDARNDLEQAATEGRISGNASAEAWALSNLALAALAVGDVAAGAQYADSSGVRFAAQGDRYGEGVVRGVDAAVAALAGAPQKARLAYRATIDLLNPLGFSTGVVSAYVGLAHLAMQQSSWAEARAHLEAARLAAGSMPGRLQGLSYHRGVLALRMHRLSEAESEFGAGLARVRADTGADGVSRQPAWAYFYGMRVAEVYARRGEVSRAEALVRKSAEALDLWRSGLSQRDLRVLAFQLAEDASDPDLGFATIVAVLAGAGRGESAFDLVERLRARELLDLLTRADGLAPADPAQPDTGPRRASEGMATRARIAASLPERTALLEYATGRGGEPTTLFVLTRSTLQTYVLDPADSLEREIARLNSLLESGSNPTDLAHSLGVRVIQAALNGLPAAIDRLVVVPDGVLHGIPFDALVTPDGRFLVERFALTVMPSATVAVHLWNLPRSTGPGRVLAFGDPALGEGDESSGMSPAWGELMAQPRLRASAREARLVASYAPGSTVLVGRAASEAWLKRSALDEYRVLHFATHAQVDEATIARTGLALARGDGEDGVVTAGELGRLKLGADLVVLSACRTGGGVVVRGEGIAGLAAPLLEAGVRAVVLTRWPIGDRSTAAFIRAFYDRLASGEPVGEALRSAKLDAIAKGAAPAQWAAFTIIGDPTVRVPLSKPRETDRFWWIALIATLVGLGAWVLRRSVRRDARV